jgi:alpha-tubulin suppressor-like RCC1 family protein
VVGLTGATQVAAGALHTRALVIGRVRCWGDDGKWQLGDGGTTQKDLSKPTAFVKAITTATSIAASANGTCARLGDGTARCWGANAKGELGDGTTLVRKAPVRVLDGTTGLPLDEVVSIGVGSAHVCAAMVGGGVRCWGDNARGQLGDATTTARPSPVRVTGLRGDASDTVTVGPTPEPEPDATTTPVPEPEPTAEPTPEPESSGAP